MKKERSSGLDIIRTGAICAIMLVHMIGHTGAMSNELRSVSWTGYAFIKFAVASGVPLFLLLTGFLQSSRGFNKKHYVSIIPVLLSYVVISILGAVSENSLPDVHVDTYKFIIKLFDYEYGYAWYVEMYIGLFLLIPFLNILYRNLQRTQKLWLIGILSFMTFFPSAVQYVTVNETGFEIFPDFFKNLYAFAFYFIGAYIAEYRPAPKKIVCIAIMLTTLILETGLYWYFSAEEHAWWLFNNNASLPHAVVGICLFLTFYNINGVALISVPAKWISKCSFEMYLLSYITDQYCYRFLDMKVWQIIIINFLIAFAGATTLRAILYPVNSGIKRLILKNENKANIIEKNNQKCLNK